MTPTAPAQAPGQVTEVSASGGQEQATVNWTAPASDGGSPITSYRVTPYIGATAQSAVTVPAPAGSKTITGLDRRHRLHLQGRRHQCGGNRGRLGGIQLGYADRRPRRPYRCLRHGRTGTGDGQLERPGQQRRQRDHGLPSDPLHRGDRSIRGDSPGSRWLEDDHRARRRHHLHLQGRRHQCGGDRARLWGSNSVTPTAPAQAPGQVSEVSASGGQEQATVNWSAPANNGGSAITSYRVTPYIGATAQSAVTVPAPAGSKTITGLAAGTTYTFKVAATNAVGTGPDSAASNSVTPTAPAQAPGQVTEVSASAGQEQATVNWTAPASDGGSPITAYRVTPYIGTTAQTAITVAAPATSKTITGLTGGTTYTFTVAAVNAIGTGPESAASNPVTPTAPTAPDAPTGVNATTGQEQATINGRPGQQRRQHTHELPGDPLHRDHRSDSGHGRRAGDVEDDHRPDRRNHLHVHGRRGQRDRHRARVGGIEPGHPDRAYGPGRSDRGERDGRESQVTVAWTAPVSDGGSPNSTYSVTPYVGTTAQSPVTVAAPATSRTITGLTGGTAYTFKVAALNAVGAGPDRPPRTR